MFLFRDLLMLVMQGLASSLYFSEVEWFPSVCHQSFNKSPAFSGNIQESTFLLQMTWNAKSSKPFGNWSIIICTTKSNQCQGMADTGDDGWLRCNFSSQRHCTWSSTWWWNLSRSENILPMNTPFCCGARSCTRENRHTVRVLTEKISAFVIRK